jgi:ketosteroid isomerase-like protein
MSEPEWTAGRFLDGLAALDVDAALAVFADDAVQEMPFAPEGFPRRLEGIAALRRQYGGLFRVVDGRIRLFREYFDPNILSDVFPADARGATFSLPGRPPATGARPR